MEGKNRAWRVKVSKVSSFQPVHSLLETFGSARHSGTSTPVYKKVSSLLCMRRKLETLATFHGLFRVVQGCGTILHARPFHGGSQARRCRTSGVNGTRTRGEVANGQTLRVEGLWLHL